MSLNAPPQPPRLKTSQGAAAGGPRAARRSTTPSVVSRKACTSRPGGFSTASACDDNALSALPTAGLSLGSALVTVSISKPFLIRNEGQGRSLWLR